MSNSDVFAYKRNPKPAGVLSTEDSILVIGSLNAANRAFLVQNWSMTYSQQVEELFEIGSNKVYWKKGRPTGQGSIARIVGAGSGSAVSGGLFPAGAFDVCDGGATMMMKVRGGACTAAPDVTFSMSGVVVSQVGYQCQVDDAQVGESISWRFSHLQIK